MGKSGKEELLQRFAGAVRAAGREQFVLAIGEVVEVVRALVERTGRQDAGSGRATKEGRAGGEGIDEEGAKL